MSVLPRRPFTLTARLVAVAVLLVAVTAVVIAAATTLVMRNHLSDKLDESVRLFERSVELDPEFARGWEGLSAACAVIVDWLSTYPDIDREAMRACAESAAERALHEATGRQPGGMPTSHARLGGCPPSARPRCRSSADS